MNLHGTPGAGSGLPWLPAPVHILGLGVRLPLSGDLPIRTYPAPSLGGVGPGLRGARPACAAPRLDA